MKAATVKLILRKDKIKKDGTAPIWIRVTANRKSNYVSTGIAIEPKHWNERKQQVRASHDIAPALNVKLAELYMKVQQEALDTPSASAVKTSLKSGGGSFSAYFQKYIDDLEANQFWEWKKYRVTLKKLKGCLGNEINWKDLDRDALLKFEHCLREKHNNGPNTIRKELQRTRRVIRRAIKDGVVKPDADPFHVYDRPQGNAPERRKLSIEEIRKLEALELDEGSSLTVARDSFILAFYGGGIRFGDVCRLRIEHIKQGRLEYRMMKTGTLVSIPLPEPALIIVNMYANRNTTYLFAFMDEDLEADGVRLRRRISSRNVVINRELKKLAKMAKIESKGLSFHVARHSFADFARRRTRDVYAISKTLGHTSLQVTQSYLRSFDRDSIDKLANELWETPTTT